MGIRRGPLQGLGIAIMLTAAAEQRVRARGLTFAALGVKDINPGAGLLVLGRWPSA